MAEAKAIVTFAYQRPPVDSAGDPPDLVVDRLQEPDGPRFL